MDKRKFSVEQLAAYMSKPEVFADITAAANHTEKRKRIEKHRQAFLSGNQSGFSSVADFHAPAVNFSAAFDSSDVGNPEMTDYSIYDNCSTFADFNKAAKAETAIGKIKSLILNRNVADSVKTYLLQRNSVIKANKAKKAERDKQKADKFTSSPSWY